MPDKVKQNNITTATASIVIILVVLIITAVMGRVIKAYYDSSTSYMEKYNSLELKYDGVVEALETCGKKVEVDQRIIDWAYKNAGNKIAKHSVTQYLSEAKKYDNFLMMVALIQVESRFDIYGLSSKNAKGLGQIMTNIWLTELVEVGIWEAEIDVYDYRHNIAAINYILIKYLEEYGSWKECLNRYVGGDKNYVTNVLSNYAELTLLTRNIAEKTIDETS